VRRLGAEDSTSSICPWLSGSWPVLADFIGCGGAILTPAPCAQDGFRPRPKMRCFQGILSQ
jgi:hypothetical protein